VIILKGSWKETSWLCTQLEPIGFFGISQENAIYLFDKVPSIKKLLPAVLKMASLKGKKKNQNHHDNIPLIRYHSWQIWSKLPK